MTALMWSKVGVVVEHDQVEGFSGSSDEQIGDLAAALASCCEEPLHLKRRATCAAVVSTGSKASNAPTTRSHSSALRAA